MGQRRAVGLRLQGLRGRGQGGDLRRPRRVARRDVHQRAFNDRAVQTLYLTLAGETLANDISFFRKVGHRPDAAPQGMAACVRTDRPWNTKYASVEPEMDAAKTRFTLRD